MKVVENGQSSDIHDLNAGVPQGSVLRPTLFLILLMTYSRSCVVIH